MNTINHQTRAELELHTIQAQNILHGNKKIKRANSGKYNTIGLKVFGFMILRIWQQIRADDPYAESVLIETERCIDNAFKFIHRKNIIIDTKLELESEFPGLKFEIYTSPNPKVIPLNSIIYSTTHANLAARLIGLYDLLVRKLVTCKKYAIISRHTFESHLSNSSQIVRGSLSAPTAYKKFNIKRQDIVQHTPNAQAAIEKLGILPAEILNKQTHSTYGPKPPRYH